MTALGTHLPISWWTLAVLVLGSLVTYPVGCTVAGWASWRRRPTVVATGLLVITLAMTIAPDPGAAQPPSGLAACIPVSWSDIPVDVAAGGGGLGGNLLNVALYLPVATALVMACRRAWPCAVLAALPPLIELIQTMLPGRSCAVTDVLTNWAGIALGALAGLLVVRRQRAREAVAGLPSDRRSGQP